MDILEIISNYSLYRSYVNYNIFDENGDRLSLETEGGNYYFTNIYFPQNSVGLNINKKLILFEKSINGLVRPLSIFGNSEKKLRIRFVKETSDIENENFYFYDVNYDNDYPTIIKKSELIIDLEDGPNLVTYDNDGIIQENGISTDPININIGFSSKEEGIYDTYIIIEEIISYDDKTSHINENSSFEYKSDNSYCKTIVIVKVHGESIGEDERFKYILDNLGLDLPPENWYLFKDIDIEDDSVNWKIINEKRKELILEHSNIWPYIGTYKGLRNVLNWLGWNDLSIKELWKSIDNKKLAYKEIWNNNKSISNLDSINSNVWKKTGDISLSFPINKDTGKVDEFGYPIVEKINDMSIDDILFKLWGIKKYIQESFLPLGNKIVDISGEGVYFEKYNIVNWYNKLKIWNSNEPTEISSSWKTYGYIEDWSWKIKYENLLSNNEYILSDLYGDTISDWYDKYLISFYNYEFPYKPLFIDSPIIGCPITLQNNSNYIKWDDLNSSWDNMIYLTWDDIQWGDFYEMEWIIEKNIPNAFSISSGRKHITDLSTWDTFLPYSGNWTLRLKMWNSQNQLFEKVYFEEIKIKNLELELSIISKSENTIKTWDDWNTSWNENTTDWNLLANTYKNKYSTNILLDNLNSALYQNQNYSLKEISTYDENWLLNRLGKMTWDKMTNVTWDDLDSITWKDYNLTFGTLCGFKITNWTLGGKIEIPYLSIFTFSGLVNTSTELINQLNSTTLDGFKEFDYSLITPSVGSPFIQATAKYPGSRSMYLLHFTLGMLSDLGAYGNSYPRLNWNSWTGTQNTPPLWCSLWNGWNEFLSGNNEGHNNIIWNTYIGEEHTNKVKSDMSQYIDDWIQESTMWLQSDTYNYKIGNPHIISVMNSKIPNFHVDSIELIINDERKGLIESNYLVYTPQESNKLEILIKGKDTNNNYNEKKFELLPI